MRTGQLTLTRYGDEVQTSLLFRDYLFCFDMMPCGIRVGEHKIVADTNEHDELIAEMRELAEHVEQCDCDWCSTVEAELDEYIHA